MDHWQGVRRLRKYGALAAGLAAIPLILSCGGAATPAVAPAPAATAAPAPVRTLLPAVAPTEAAAPKAPIATVGRPVAVVLAIAIIDDAVNATLAGVSDDEALFANVEKDAELIGVDSQAISDFGQSYDE